MCLFILGATGGISQHLLRIGLERGHELTAYVRSPHKIPSAERRPSCRAICSMRVRWPDLSPGTTPCSPRSGRRRSGPPRCAASSGAGWRRPCARPGWGAFSSVSAAFLFRKIGMLAGRSSSPPVPVHGAGHGRHRAGDHERRPGMDGPAPPRLTDGPPTRSYRVADGELPASGYVISLGRTWRIS